jgi:hypothetical protein
VVWETEVLPEFIRKQLEKSKCFRNLSASNWENRNASGIYPRAVGKIEMIPEFIREQFGK